MQIKTHNNNNTFLIIINYVKLTGYKIINTKPYNIKRLPNASDVRV